MTPRLTLTGVRRSFGGGRGLQGVDLQLAAGEIYALLGPNGAGKTSLIRAIAGRLRLDAGQVLLDDADPRTHPAARRGLGLVPQEIALYGELTVRENLSLLGRLAGLTAREARAATAQALTWIDLADRADIRVAILSGGQKRRVNLAAATLHQPGVLLLDEPTVGVDPPARERIHDLLGELRARGTAILLATHDLDQAAALSDRIGILVDGALQAEGTLAQLVRGAFGASRALDVTLGRAPDGPQRGALEASGLASGVDPCLWSGPLASGLEALPATAARLVAAGLALLEIRVREPDLRGVFFRVAGRDFDA